MTTPPRTRLLPTQRPLIQTPAPADPDPAPMPTPADPAPADPAPAPADPAPAAGGGGSTGGTVTIGGETIELDSARCFLQEQDSGSGKILFTGQGFGTNAAGEDVLIDISRYDEDSQFTGDDVLVDIGSVTWHAVEDIGAITLDGRTMSAAGMSFSNFDDPLAHAVTGSFEVNC